MTKKADQAAQVTKTSVRPNTENYTSARSASGAKSLNNGDPVAQALEGATMDEVFALASEATETTVKDLKTKYGHLNDGMQRMNLGNRLRGIVGGMNKEKDGSGDKWIKGLSSGLRQAVDARVKAAAAEKQAKEKAAAAEKQAKEKAAKAAKAK